MHGAMENCMDPREFPPDVQVIYDAFVQEFGEPEMLESSERRVDYQTLTWIPKADYDVGNYAVIRLRRFQRSGNWYLLTPRLRYEGGGFVERRIYVLDKLHLDEVMPALRHGWKNPIRKFDDFMITVSNHKMKPEMLFMNRQEYIDLFGQEPPEPEPPSEEEINEFR